MLRICKDDVTFHSWQENFLISSACVKGVTEFHKIDENAAQSIYCNLFIHYGLSSCWRAFLGSHKPIWKLHGELLGRRICNFHNVKPEVGECCFCWFIKPSGD